MLYRATRRVCLHDVLVQLWLKLLRDVMVLQYVLLRKLEVLVLMALSLLPDGSDLKRELAG